MELTARDVGRDDDEDLPLESARYCLEDVDDKDFMSPSPVLIDPVMKSSLDSSTVTPFSSCGEVSCDLLRHDAIRVLLRSFGFLLVGDKSIS